MSFIVLSARLLGLVPRIQLGAIGETDGAECVACENLDALALNGPQARGLGKAYLEAGENDTGLGKASLKR